MIQIQNNPKSNFNNWSVFKNKKSFRVVILNQSKLNKIRNKASESTTTNYYGWNSEDINQLLSVEINETFATYYDEIKNLDDSWKPKSLQGEKSKALLFLPFLPKWEIQNDKRIFTGIWDVRNKQQYDMNEKFVQIIWPQILLLDQRIMGTLLANGSVRASTPQFDFSLKNAQHVYWKYIYLKPFCNLAPKLCKNQDNRTGKIYYYYKFWTRSVFKDYRQLFYPNGKKIVPFCVPELLSAPEGLAEFYMDIGTFNKSKNDYFINANSFSRDELKYLQEQLLNYHGLESQIHKFGNYLRMYLSPKNEPIIVSKLNDHLLPMFYSTIGLTTGLQKHEIESFNRLDLREFQRSINNSDQQ